MKSLTDYINESKNDIVSLLNNFKVDFSSTASMPSDTKEQRYAKGKAQEKIFIDTMNDGVLPEKYTVMSIEDWCEKNDIDYSQNVDCRFGDIVINDDKEDWFIDLKVAMDGSKKSAIVGTPTAMSLVRFSDQKNHIYFLSNITGTTVYIVDADKLMNLMKSKDASAYFVATKYRVEKNNVYHGVRDLNGKVNIKVSNSHKTDDDVWSTDVIDNEDFVSTFTIKQNYKRIKA